MTLLRYFPTKEALVFDEDEDRETDLVAAVRDRPAGMSIPAALRRKLREMYSGSADDPAIVAYRELIASTPALSDYSRRMWLRHERSLAQAIADDIGVLSDDIACRALARFTLEVRDLIRARENPGQADGSDHSAKTRSAEIRASVYSLVCGCELPADDSCRSCPLPHGRARL